MTEAAAPRSIVIDRAFAHRPEKIWRALTQSSLIAEWLRQNDFLPVVGHRFNLRAPPMPQWNGVTDCEVLVIEPNEHLSYTWNASGTEAANGLSTIVTWTLTPTGDGTLVRMEQSGFRQQDERNYQGANYGWQRFLGGLERVVATLAWRAEATDAAKTPCAGRHQRGPRNGRTGAAGLSEPSRHGEHRGV